LASPTVTDRTYSGMVYERDFGSVIGTDLRGMPSSRLRVIVDYNGTVISAFSVPNP
jgi:hypothetical protein